MLFIEQEPGRDALVLLLDRLLQRVRDRANSEAKRSLLSDEQRRECVREVRAHVADDLNPTLRSDINICLTILEPVASTAAFSFAEILRSANQMLAAPAGSADFSATRYLRNQLGSIRQQHEARKTTGDEKAEAASSASGSADAMNSAVPTSGCDVPSAASSASAANVVNSANVVSSVSSSNAANAANAANAVSSEISTNAATAVSSSTFANAAVGAAVGAAESGGTGGDGGTEAEREGAKRREEADEQEERMRRIREEMRRMQ